MRSARKLWFGFSLMAIVILGVVLMLHAVDRSPTATSGC